MRVLAQFPREFAIRPRHPFPLRVAELRRRPAEEARQQVQGEGREEEQVHAGRQMSVRHMVWD